MCCSGGSGPCSHTRLAPLSTGPSPPYPRRAPQVPSSFLQQQLVPALGPGVLTPGRTNGAANMVEAMKKRARLLAAPHTMAVFPSLRITADSLTPQVGRGAGATAEG